MTVPLTMRALIQRINRKDDRRLRTTRGWFSDFDRYYVLDFKNNWIVEGRPEALGRDLGVLIGGWSYPNT